MRRIAIIGDVHNHRQRLDVVLDLLAQEKPDLCLFTGDIGQDPPWNSPARRTQRREHDASVRSVLSSAQEQLRCPVLLVPGNHDLSDPIEDVSGVNIDGQIHEVAGLRLAGFGGAGPAIFGFPNEWSEEQADERLSDLFGKSTSGVDIFLSHTPPSDCSLDRIFSGEHVGSRSVRKWIAQSRPSLFVCGHIHEACGVAQIEGVHCLNAGALGEPYGQAIAWCVDWDSGPLHAESIRRPAGGSVQRSRHVFN
jgi:Icc-related predicted phosphoesterase